MKAWAREIKQNALMRWSGLYKFQPKLSLFISAGPYILKTAESHEELIASFKLRHEVFYQEFQKVENEGIDFDKFDTLFDHLIIVHKSTNKVIGTYRINCSSFSSSSYTELEFNLDNIFNLPGPHLELGRACIHTDHRRGTVLSLLWRGITEYMNLSGANVLFGCSSTKINSSIQAALVYRYFFERGALFENVLSSPTKNFKMHDFDILYASYQDKLSEAQNEEAEKIIPPLLKSYIRFGAKIASQPAFDKDFNCVDFLTVLKKDDMINSLANRFQLIQ
jgi:putative hemolysin